MIFFYYRAPCILKLNIVALVMLLVFVAIQMPLLFIEAFNLVTTNLALIGLNYVLPCNNEGLQNK